MPEKEQYRHIKKQLVSFIGFFTKLWEKQSLMNLPEFSNRFAETNNAKYTEYDDNTSVFVLRLRDARFQNVLVRIIDHEKSGKKIVHVSSKVCSAEENINYPELLSAIVDSVHTRFIAEDGFIKTEAAFFLDQLNEDIISDMINEVAEIADTWELKITGEDIQ